VRFSERGPRLRVERARARPEVHNLNTHAAMTHASIMHACVAVAGSNHYSFHLRAQRSIFAVRVGDVAFSRAHWECRSGSKRRTCRQMPACQRPHTRPSMSYAAMSRVGEPFLLPKISEILLH